ncbi:MAG: hypothetical protein ABDH20_04225 [Thermus sp.]
MTPEERQALEARFREDLAWYERELEACWKQLAEERTAWQETKRRLLEGISRCSHRVRALEAKGREREKEVEALKRRLEALDRPALGEGWLAALRKELDHWDQRLVEKVGAVRAGSLEEALEELLGMRLEALRRHLQGERPDFKALYTALVLEWALWAWLEGEWQTLGNTP